MREIDVRPAGSSYEVRVDDGRGVSRHQVTVDASYHREVASDISVERLIEASFEFLLDREPKESILASFDLSVIERYFPDYRSTIGTYV